MSRYLMPLSLLNSWRRIYEPHEYSEGQSYRSFSHDLHEGRSRSYSDSIKLSSLGLTSGRILPKNIAWGLKAPVHKIMDIVWGREVWGEIERGIARGTAPQIAQEIQLYKDKTIGGINFLLYGILDYLKEGIIYDIRSTERYEIGQFCESIEHPFYFELCPEAHMFEYIVADAWSYSDGYNTDTEYEVFSEQYRRPENCSVLERTITEFMEFLEFHNLKRVYFEKWGV